jgi:rare lipoprotein A
VRFCQVQPRARLTIAGPISARRGLRLNHIHSLTLLGLLCFSGRDMAFQNPAQEALTTQLAFRVEPAGFDLRLIWNGDAPMLRDAFGGVVWIEDGGRPPVQVKLNRHDLRTATVLYTPATERVRFRLDVTVGELAWTASQTSRSRSPNGEETGIDPVSGESVRTIPIRAAPANTDPAHSASNPSGLHTPSAIQATDAVREPFVQTGIATFYDSHRGNDDLTAAHLTLPIGWRVRVTNLANGRSVLVRVASRGGSSNGQHVINLSRGAAEELGFVRAGRARVRVTLE